MQNANITLNQAKLQLNDFLIDSFGFDSEPLIKKVNACKTHEELRDFIQTVIKTSPKDISHNLISLWSKISFNIKK